MAAEMPTFATVLICLDSVCEANTQNTQRQFALRVPLTPSMSVRQLAKEAMKRLVALARHRPTAAPRDGCDVFRFAQHAHPKLAVTEVVVVPALGRPQQTKRARVAASSIDARNDPAPAHSAELFSCDCLTHVVDLSCEVVRLTLCHLDPEAPWDRSQGTAPIDALPASASSESTIELHKLPPRGTLPASAGAANTGKRPRDEDQEESTQPIDSLSLYTRKTHTFGSSTDTDSSEESEEESATNARRAQEELEAIALLRERETASRLRWGRDAHKHFANNYISSPEKLMSRRYARARREIDATHTQPTQRGAVREQTGTTDDSPPPLTAPAGACGNSRSHQKRLASPPQTASHAAVLVSDGHNSPPAIPPELLPDAPVPTSLAAARQLHFDDDEDELTSQINRGHSYGSVKSPRARGEPCDAVGHLQYTPPLMPQSAPLFDSTPLGKSCTATPRSRMTTTTTAAAAAATAATPNRTPSHFLAGPFSQPLPAVFRKGVPSHTSTPAKVVVSCVEGDSPSPRTPQTVPRAAPALTPATQDDEHSDLPPARGSSVRKPVGWGKAASQFFDESTYCDDPKKAVLDASQLNQPVRARRNKEPSPILRHIL